MKQLSLQKMLPGSGKPDMNQLTARMKEEVPAVSLESVNWKADYPYCPEVAVRLAYDESCFYLHYQVAEQEMRMAAREDMEPVWEDSCVEFFLRPEEKGGYYNFEFNAGGVLLLAYGENRHHRTAAPQEVLASVIRQVRLERLPLADRQQRFQWSLLAVIPFTALFMHRFQPQSAEGVSANFYKCGDKLKTPHFISWSPVDTPGPDFHRPEYFGRLCFK